MKPLQSPYLYGLKTKRAEVATNELSALDINASGLETRMPFEHHVGDSAPSFKTYNDTCGVQL